MDRDWSTVWAEAEMVNKPMNHAKGCRNLACLEVAMENGIISEHDGAPNITLPSEEEEQKLS